MQPEGRLETVIYAADLEAAERFYGEVLVFEVFVKVEGRHVFYRCGNQMLLIFDPVATATPAAQGIPVPTHGAKGPGHLCFRAPGGTIDDWRRHLDAAGVEIEMDFEWPQGGRSIYFRDPAGNSLEFAEPRIWRLD